MPDSNPALPFGRSVHLYGRETAATIQAVTAQDKDRTPTLNIQVVRLTARRKGERKEGQWDEMKPIQVSATELPVFAAVIAGFQTHLDAKFHGKEKNNSYHLSWDDSVLYLAHSNAGTRHAIGLTASGRYRLLNLVLEQLSRGQATPTDVLNMLKVAFSPPHFPKSDGR